MDIRIGTSGFSYADWKGFFYPPGIKSTEMLPFYAQRFPVVEINSTYYRPPTASTLYQMARKVPEGFEFVLKAHQDMTHSGTFVPEAWADFRDALAPLREAGMLGGVLAQFPWSFRRTPENMRYLDAVRSELPGTPVVVEFRNAEWLAEGAREETLARLRALDLGYCCVDEPRLRGLLPPLATRTSDVGYVRFHGRNAQKWWQHDHAYERYDYLYSQEELAEWAPKILQLASETEKTYVFFNNHYEGKAGHNARQMAELLRISLPLPEEEPQPSLALQDP